MNDSERPTLRDEIDILRKNVYDLQEQLQNAYKRISKLSNDMHDLKFPPTSE